MIDISLPDTNAELAVLMRERLGIRGADRLAVKMRRGGRLLPKAVRRQAAYLVEAEKQWGNPRLRRVIDEQKVTKAQADLRRHLEGIDPRDRLKGRLIGIAAPLAFNLLVVAGLLIAWLVWTGRV
jgi:hypothetical protein